MFIGMSLNNLKPDVSIVLPCKNEEAALQKCINDIKKNIKDFNFEIIVSDSSTDQSPAIAQGSGAKLIKHDQDGYGIACRKGLEAATGDYLILLDADGTYDAAAIPVFIDKLKSGCDFVVGNRFAGKIEKGAMPWLHRYIGNPLLSGILRSFYRIPVHDAHCGLRGIKRSKLADLELKTGGMEFASEMVVMAGRTGLKISEVPVNYFKRVGESKLRSFSDGWRHLRFLLLYSPMYLFFVPGFALFVAGVVTMALLYFDKLVLFGLHLQVHPMFVSALLIIAGYQLMIFALFAKTYAMTHLQDSGKLMNKLYRIFTIERVSLGGLVFLGFGLWLYWTILQQWIGSDFGQLNRVKDSIIALIFLVVGIQTIFSSFMLSILGIKKG